MSASFPIRLQRIALPALLGLIVGGCGSTRIGSPGVHPSVIMDAHVDARELPRGLLHTRMCIPVRPGRIALRFPKWIPGTHGPTQRVRNVGRLRFETPDGTVLPWHRDEVELHRFIVDIPAGTQALTAYLSYICNQPTDSSRPVDSHGGTPIGVINWNTCLLYPEDLANDELDVRLSVELPAGWKYATALPVEPSPDAAAKAVRFGTETLRDVIDSPLIAGKHFRSVQLRQSGGPPVYLHAVSEPAEGINFGDGMVSGCRRLVAEAEALFGRAHYPSYHFLVVCTDFIRPVGLEHFRCSLNGVNAKGLIDEALFKVRPAYLLPHEYVHSWCGKFRRPAGMHTRDYHTPKRTRLLWVYEGLTQYLGYVLAVRSGLDDKGSMLERLSGDLAYLRRHVGRRWRPLVDTAVANHTLRGGSRQWVDLRRGQDYYPEGALFWLEADLIIRVLTGGVRSLDDFCRAFFGENPGGRAIHPFDLEDVIEALGRVAPYDWRRLIANRIYSTQDALPLDAVRLAGYRLARATKPSKERVEYEGRSKYVNALESIGLALHRRGKIVGLVKDSPAYRAGLGYDMYVMEVNGQAYSAENLRKAIAESPKTGKILLLIWDRGRYRGVPVAYQGGPKYLYLQRDPDRPDLFGEILKPCAVK